MQAYGGALANQIVHGQIEVQNISYFNYATAPVLSSSVWENLPFMRRH